MINVVERAKRNMTSCGLYITIADPQIVEMAKTAGYDFARLDAEHGGFDPRTLAEMFRTARLLDFPLQIRMGMLENMDAVLSMEPAAVMVPDIRNPDDAKELARSTKFAPLGQRGMYSFTDAVRFGGMSRKEYMEYANNHIHTIVQIESLDGIKNLDEILRVPGIDMVSSGKADLSQAFGIPGQTTAAEIIKAEEKIVETALRHGKVPALFAKSPERIRRLYEIGVRCFITGFDIDICMNAMRKQTGDFRKISGEIRNMDGLL